MGTASKRVGGPAGPAGCDANLNGNDVQYGTVMRCDVIPS